MSPSSLEKLTAFSLLVAVMLTGAAIYKYVIAGDAFGIIYAVFCIAVIIFYFVHSDL